MSDRKAFREGLAGEIKRLKADLEILEDKKKRNTGPKKEISRKIKELNKKIADLNSRLNGTGDAKGRSFFEHDPIKKY